MVCTYVYMYSLIWLYIAYIYFAYTWFFFLELIMISFYLLCCMGLLYNNESAITAALWANKMFSLISLCTCLISDKCINLSTLNLLHSFCAIRYTVFTHIWSLVIVKCALFCVSMRKKNMPDTLQIICPTLLLNSQCNLFYNIKRKMSS